MAIASSSDVTMAQAKMAFGDVVGAADRGSGDVVALREVMLAHFGARSVTQPALRFILQGLRNVVGVHRHFRVPPDVESLLSDFEAFLESGGTGRRRWLYARLKLGSDGDASRRALTKQFRLLEEASRVWPSHLDMAMLSASDRRCLEAQATLLDLLGRFYNHYVLGK
jgi:hypothetical protein